MFRWLRRKPKRPSDKELTSRIASLIDGFIDQDGLEEFDSDRLSVIVYDDYTASISTHARIRQAIRQVPLNRLGLSVLKGDTSHPFRHAGVYIAAELVVAGLPSRTDGVNESPKAPNPVSEEFEFELTPTTPDITKRQPVRAFEAQDCMIFFLRDVPSLVAHANYPLVMAAVNRKTLYPMHFVTLERSGAGQFLCCFSKDGSHQNFGRTEITENAFVSRALSIIQAQLQLKNVRELRKG